MKSTYASIELKYAQDLLEAMGYEDLHTFNKSMQAHIVK